jgi:hypothetical protein
MTGDDDDDDDHDEECGCLLLGRRMTDDMWICLLVRRWIRSWIRLRQRSKNRRSSEEDETRRDVVTSMIPLGVSQPETEVIPLGVSHKSRSDTSRGITVCDTLQSITNISLVL